MRTIHRKHWLLGVPCAAIAAAVTVAHAQSGAASAATQALGVFFSSLVVQQNGTRANIMVGASNLDQTLMCYISTATRDMPVPARGREITDRLNTLSQETGLKDGDALAGKLEVRRDNGEWVLAAKGDQGHLITCDTIMARRVYTTTPHKAAQRLLNNVKLHLTRVTADADLSGMAPKDRGIDERQVAALLALGQGDMYYNQKRLPEAMERYRAAIELFPECDTAYSGLEQCYRDRNRDGDREKAERLAVLLTGLRAALDQKINGDKAWDDAEAVEKTNPTEARAGYAEARRCYAAARTLFPSSDTFYTYESMAAEKMGDIAGARSVLENALDQGTIIDDIRVLPGRDSFKRRLEGLSGKP